MKRRWGYAITVFVLFGIVVVGVPLFPEVLGASVNGRLTVGMLVFLLLHTVPLVLSALYLRARVAESPDL